MNRSILAVAMVFGTAASPAFAGCGDDTTGFSCMIDAKAVEICITKTGLRYQFGPEGAPELSIDQPFDQTGYLPWTGIGRSIHDEVVFSHDGHSYLVWQSLDKIMEENQPEPEWQGGLSVDKDGQNILTADCDAASLQPNMDQISEAMYASGLCWNHESFAWAKACE